MSKNYMTPHGFKRLQDEYEYLKLTERPKVTKLVSWAASLGDRSENADYQYGKKRLREIDRRLRFLGKRIHDAEIVDPLKSSSHQENAKVTFGATVTIEDEEGEERIVSIVGVDETDSRAGRVSWKSPLGSALLSKTLGDDVTVKAPGGEREYEITKIEFIEIKMKEYTPPEEQGDLGDANPDKS